MWIFPPAACLFSSFAAAVARGRIRKSQRNQSFKRYATAVRRKDLRAQCHRPRRHAPGKIASQASFVAEKAKTKAPDREAGRSGSFGTAAAPWSAPGERRAAAQGVGAAQSRPGESSGPAASQAIEAPVPVALWPASPRWLCWGWDLAGPRGRTHHRAPSCLEERLVAAPLAEWWQESPGSAHRGSHP